LAKAFLKNPLQAVQNVPAAIQYLEGADIYADRSLFPLPSIILIDLHMPEKDGFELLEWLRDRPQFQNLHRIVISGVERMSDTARAYQLGAHAFLTKPLKEDDLRNLARAFPDAWT